ncbi:MAG: SUF system NifU family Fe-S cluster assembly protein, partial [Chloroflexi bacterium]|nr:SUF system NifU family Fe-S cluster assembly protein [Chloroflexota bacterium]
ITASLEDESILEIKFDGHGCSISQASASMLTEQVKGKRLTEAEDLVELIKSMFKGEVEIDPDELGDLEALQGIRRYPVRIKCATLAWNALQVGIDTHRSSLEDAEAAPELAVFTEHSV